MYRATTDDLDPPSGFVLKELAGKQFEIVKLMSRIITKVYPRF